MATALRTQLRFNGRLVASSVRSVSTSRLVPRTERSSQCGLLGHKQETNLFEGEFKLSYFLHPIRSQKAQDGEP